ncbi:hypothetical protein [Paenibacillus sp. SN-8-1]|uniref:hypothetical protein n=1 Tax=Paenibacillus sp. SN-8-1 TaxID=3435409 RepID=UPI003D9A25A1
MDSINKRSLTLLIVAATVLILLALVILFYWPLTQQLASTKSEKAELASKIKIMQKVYKQKMDSKVELDEAVVQAALPLWDNSEQFIVQLQEVGEKSGANLKNGSLNFKESNELHLQSNLKEQIYKNVQELSVNMTVAGTKQQVHDWIQKLEELPRLTIVNNLQLSSVGASDSYTANISVSIYFDKSYIQMLHAPILPNSSE